eukprot:1181533-Prorocentrum_minimum.AAC.2
MEVFQRFGTAADHRGPARGTLVGSEWGLYHLRSHEVNALKFNCGGVEDAPLQTLITNDGFKLGLRLHRFVAMGNKQDK